MGLLYTYFTCNLTNSRDSPSPSPCTHRHPTAAAAAKAACKEEYEGNTTTHRRGAGHGVARGARRATTGAIGCGAYGAHETTAAPESAAAHLATMGGSDDPDSADSTDNADNAGGVAALGHSNYMKRSTDKARITGINDST